MKNVGRWLRLDDRRKLMQFWVDRVVGVGLVLIQGRLELLQLHGLRDELRLLRLLSLCLLLFSHDHSFGAFARRVNVVLLWIRDVGSAITIEPTRFLKTRRPLSRRVKVLD